MPIQSIPLEDTFADVLRKAMRGAGVNEKQLSDATGISAAAIADWLKENGAADDAQARALAAVLRLDGGKLADSAAQRWTPPHIELSDVRRHSQEPHPSNGYVFFLDGGREAALVDPAGIPQNLLRLLRDGDYHLHYILITHKHPDHCDATADVAAAFPAAKIVMHALDVHAIGALAAKATLLRDGETLPFGGDATIRMLHTPGHTDGSSSYLFQNALFSGDTLFAASVGGAFGDASTYEDILNSVRSKLFTLPGDTVVMPGHGPPSTIELERQHNPFFT
ncbi:MAG: MBL fold metallo-hydrolase [Candidatus Eremiobacteraeota bacterium]|nr:MBL fold metallo-hydrolase [Candidatus Eremiobacteraeota bacterium]MBV8498254.1 MBL fold metallo-hydrolase [Candidatus Eremiobacteraeota bacterium]